MNPMDIEDAKLIRRAAEFIAKHEGNPSYLSKLLDAADRVEAAAESGVVPSGSGGLVEFQGCARKDGKPFVITSIDGNPIGQLTPGEATNMGIRAIQAAVESERDAATILGLKAAGGEFDDKTIASFLLMIRANRGQVDPDPRNDVEPGAAR